MRRAAVLDGGERHKLAPVGRRDAGTEQDAEPRRKAGCNVARNRRGPARPLEEVHAVEHPQVLTRRHAENRAEPRSGATRRLGVQGEGGVSSVGIRLTDEEHPAHCVHCSNGS